MNLALQSDQYGPIRYESDVCWRHATSNLADSVIGGALRSPECQVDDWQRLLGEAALQDLEEDVYTGIQLQVRVMRLRRFPIRGIPIKLDWRTAWSRDRWSTWKTDVAAMDTGVQKTAMLAAEAKVEACFDSADDAPFQVSYVTTDGRVLLDSDAFDLRNKSCGDCLFTQSSCWPSVCSTEDRNYIEIKYLVGFGSSDEFRQLQPNLLANVAAMFNYRYENPEIMGGNSSKTYELLTQFFRKNLSWRV